VFRPVGRQQHNRGFWTLQQVLLCVGDRAITADHPHIPSHQRKRFAVAAFAGAKPLDGVRMGGITGKVKAAKPTDGDNLTLLNERSSAVHVVY
jgi:hypothetical protein